MNNPRIQYREQTEHGGYLYPLETYRFHFNLEGKNQSQLCATYHWHPEIEIIVVESGGLAITIEGREYTGDAGDFFFVNSGFLHTIYARPERSTAYSAIVFDLSFLSFQMYDYVQSHYLTPLLSGKLKFPEKLESSHPAAPAAHTLLQNILAANDRQPEHYQLETKLSLLSLLTQLYREDLFVAESDRSRKISGEQITQIKDILSYIQEHYQEKILLDDIAAAIHLSPKYFSRYFKKQFGRPFTEYLNDFRVEQSLTILENPEYSVSDAAMQSGFDSLSYYVKVFKKIMGMTPGEYRSTDR